MSDIFVSYRRGGAASGYSSRLADDLAIRFGRERIFRDVQNLGIGSFEDQIEEAARRCKAMVVMIGDKWIERVPELDDPEDWVRRELGIAFERRIPVIPVLVGEVSPRDLGRLQLSPPLDALPRQQAFDLSERHWTADVESLVGELGKIRGLKPRRRSREPSGAGRWKWAVGGAGFLLVALLLIGLGSEPPASTPVSSDAIETPAPVSNPAPARAAVPTAPNLSGWWVDNEGTRMQIQQSGQNVVLAFAGFPPSGEGRVEGNQISFVLVHPEMGEGYAQGRVSPDGSSISGSVRYAAGSYAVFLSRL